MLRGSSDDKCIENQEENSGILILIRNILQQAKILYVKI